MMRLRYAEGMQRIVYQKLYTVSYFHDVLTGERLGEVWENVAGKRERDGDLPALTVYEPATGSPGYRVWYSGGVFHRENGPAYERIDPATGIVVAEAWFQSGRLHREGDFPARTHRSSETGNVIQERYLKNGQRHRFDGPAIIKYDPVSGIVTSLEYWACGYRIPRNINGWEPPLRSP